MRIVFSGSIGRYPIGGHAWTQMHWLAGLCKLGHDVVYVEECGAESYVYDWEAERLTNDLGYPSEYVRECLSGIGLDGRWIYRASDQAIGMEVDHFQDACRSADLLIVRGVPLALWRREYLLPSRRIFIDVDPGFTQVRLAKGDRELVETVERCERLFTIGHAIGTPDCAIPTGGFEWVTTVPPVFLGTWPETPRAGATHFTAVMHWRGHHDVEYNGLRLGQKDAEFPRFIDVPQLTRQPFRIALTGAPPETLEERGWEVVTGWQVSKTPWAYQAFIQESRAEFGVAKHGYVASRAGWFSDRSVCYLASGKPVLVEDTGLADWLPVGEGIVAFADLDSVLEGIEAINGDYDRHSRAARRLAEEVFSAEHVIPRLLEAAVG